MRIRKKVSVMDTSALLDSGTKMIDVLSGHLIVIPMTVIAELARFKGEKSLRGKNARNVIRFIDNLRKKQSKKLFNKGGAYIKGLNIRVSIAHDEDISPDLSGVRWFSGEKNKPDYRILNIAYFFQKSFPRCDLTLWTQDLELRLDACFFGIKSKGIPESILFLDDSNSNDLYTGFRSIELTSSELINEFWSNNVLLHSQGYFLRIIKI